MHDYDYPVMDLPVPLSVVEEYGGTSRGLDGSLKFTPPPIEVPRARLMFGDHDLGEWAVDSISANHRAGGSRYVAHMRRVGR